ncbi:SDR family oxidoreductase [Alcaligenaceae bacterium]|nr:SDR family oxidoreductase [Alcaligenaceae bacterium]
MKAAPSVLITGGAGGIGKATAACFAKEGYRVSLLDLNEAVHEAAQMLSTRAGQVQGRVVDVADETQLIAAARWHLSETAGKCDVLVNCAGISPKGQGGPFALPEITTAQWERVHRVNVTAPFILCRELIPVMAERGFGRVINVSSRAARTYVPASGLDYHTSKTALLGLTRALAGAYGRHGVTVNSVAPGRIATAMAQATRQDFLDETLRMIPAGRFGEPQEIGELILFLASEKAAYINGACIDANGGIYMT